MRKSWLVVIILLAVLGAVTAGASLKLYWQLQTIGIDQPSFCNLSPTMNCEIVQASSYATILGMPISGLGMCLYILLALLALAVFIIPTLAPATAAFAWWLCLGSVVYSAFLAYVSSAVLRVWCPTCLVMYGINLILWFAWWTGGKVRLNRLLRIPHFWRYAVTTLVVMGVGAIFLTAHAKSLRHVTAQQIKDAVYAFEKGSLYTLPSNFEQRPVWGNPNAKVTIMEFSDLECPFCKIAALNIIPNLQEYHDKVRVVFLNYPLDQSCNKNVQFAMHQNACLGAMAIMCAFKQGQFWEYSEDVFRNQRQIALPLLTKLAEKHGLDMAQFNACVAEQQTLPLIQNDIEAGKQAAINGTPAIFVNGKSLRAWRIPEVLRAVIDAELAKVQ